MAEIEILAELANSARHSREIYQALSAEAPDAEPSKLREATRKVWSASEKGVVHDGLIKEVLSELGASEEPAEPAGPEPLPEGEEELEAMVEAGELGITELEDETVEAEEE